MRGECQERERASGARRGRHPSASGRVGRRPRRAVRDGGSERAREASAGRAVQCIRGKRSAWDSSRGRSAIARGHSRRRPDAAQGLAWPPHRAGIAVAFAGLGWGARRWQDCAATATGSVPLWLPVGGGGIPCHLRQGWILEIVVWIVWASFQIKVTWRLICWHMT